MLAEVNQVASWIKERIKSQPQVGIILGTGLGSLADEIGSPQVIEYATIPGFPKSTVEGHQGRLIFGELGGVNVMAMQGRFHYYEGYSMQTVTFPVRVMKQLGVEFLLLSNASGGVNPDFEIGDIMIIDDHINLFNENPLTGPTAEEFGPRFTDMSEPYDRSLIEKAKKIANEHQIEVRQGVYAGLQGPTYETPAEYNYVRIIGADAVGMSTVPEVIVARQMNIPCFAVSVITDLGVKGKIAEITHEEVQEVAQNTEPKLTLLVKTLLSNLKTQS